MTTALFQNLVGPDAADIPKNAVGVNKNHSAMRCVSAVLPLFFSAFLKPESVVAHRHDFVGYRWRAKIQNAHDAGVSKQVLSNWLNGSRSPSLVTYFKIREFLERERDVHREPEGGRVVSTVLVGLRSEMPCEQGKPKSVGKAASRSRSDLEVLRCVAEEPRDRRNRGRVRYWRSMRLSRERRSGDK